jgi:6-phosphogluconolactonase
MVTLNLKRIEKTDIKLFLNNGDLCEVAAEDFAQRSTDAVKTKGVFNVVLTGGNTPKSFLDTLAQKKHIPWPHIRFFLTDERYVDFDNPASNYRMINDHLFSKTPVKRENIYPMPTNYSDPKKAAQHYSRILRKAFEIHHPSFPAFDLLYLGLGEDAHTASLMPFSKDVETYKKHQLAGALWVPPLNQHRLTLTANAINHAACINFLVTGANKASAVSAVLNGPFEPSRYPAQLIHSINGHTTWYLEQSAAENLKGLKDA